jgi:hypothetical protein
VVQPRLADIAGGLEGARVETGDRLPAVTATVSAANAAVAMTAVTASGRGMSRRRGVERRNGLRARRRN